jgi:hypothetical protein
VKKYLDRLPDRSILLQSQGRLDCAAGEVLRGSKFSFYQHAYMQCNILQHHTNIETGIHIFSGEAMRGSYLEPTPFTSQPWRAKRKASPRSLHQQRPEQLFCLFVATFLTHFCLQVIHILLHQILTLCMIFVVAYMTDGTWSLEQTYACIQCNIEKKYN